MKKTRINPSAQKPRQRQKGEADQQKKYTYVEGNLQKLANINITNCTVSRVEYPYRTAPEKNQLDTESARRDLLDHVMWHGRREELEGG